MQCVPLGDARKGAELAADGGWLGLAAGGLVVGWQRWQTAALRPSAGAGSGIGGTHSVCCRPRRLQCADASAHLARQGQ
jgi:hypothetical protein